MIKVVNNKVFLQETPSNFDIRELVPEAIYNRFKEKSCWFLDPETVKMLQGVRTWFDAPLLVNNWHQGGQLHQRGFRPPDSIGAALSQHRRGAAFDINISGKTPQQVYKDILDNEQFFLDLGLTTLENIQFTPTWCHLDTRSTGLTEILIVNP